MTEARSAVDASTLTEPASARRRTRLLAVAGAALAALAVWLVVEPILGVELRAPATGGNTGMDVGPAIVAIMALAASLAGWALLAVLERATSRAGTVWLAVALVVLAVSLSGPFSGAGVTAANRVGLALMHLAVGAVLIPALHRSSSSGRSLTSGPTRG